MLPPGARLTQPLKSLRGCLGATQQTHRHWPAVAVDLDTPQGNRDRCPVFGLGSLRDRSASMDTPDDRRARLEKALQVAREHGNPFLESNILKALRELEKQG